MLGWTGSEAGCADEEATFERLEAVCGCPRAVLDPRPPLFGKVKPPISAFPSDIGCPAEEVDPRDECRLEALGFAFA